MLPFSRLTHPTLGWSFRQKLEERQPFLPTRNTTVFKCFVASVWHGLCKFRLLHAYLSTSLLEPGWSQVSGMCVLMCV